jgi:hypothetical protein
MFTNLKGKLLFSNNKTRLGDLIVEMEVSSLSFVLSPAMEHAMSITERSGNKEGRARGRSGSSLDDLDSLQEWTYLFLGVCLVYPEEAVIPTLESW